MDNEFKYYLVFSEDYSMLELDDIEFDKNGNKKLFFKLNSSIPRKSVMPDFLEYDEIIVSKRIAKVMQEMNMEGVQFLKTKIKMPEGKIIEDYVGVNLKNNTYEVMDKEKSDYKKGRQGYIRKIVLDHKILEKIPLNERLCFQSEEALYIPLFHKSVVEKVLALNPTGVDFIDVEEYDFFKINDE